MVFGLEEERSRLDAVLIRANGKVSLLKTQAIDWIETEGNYVRLHAGRESHLLRETIAAFELKLDRSQFVRIHRSAIVNVERVVQFESLFNGDFSVLLKDGKQLRMSRTYRGRVHDLLGRSFEPRKLSFRPALPHLVTSDPHSREISLSSPFGKTN